jgi:3-aminobutyryl-CoA ammonia-lyase
MGDAITLAASLRVRMSAADAHYGGGLVSGARVLELIHDLATELSIRHDGDEGLFAGYSSIEFLAPVHAGDYLEARGEIVRVGRSSREMRFTVVRYAQPRPDISDSAADLVDPPEPVLRATGTCVVKQEQQRRSDTDGSNEGSDA